ncbi:protein of unknown function [uncultured Sphingopyxis sp.]|uniref:Uncharacterized protein n=1 Tax=uncultured Sphingopyxis sp. TaxID=310581 RepID=A0A1Y5Q096_9SPHN|nr:protein of unknown function [uncultured Sphingopyxis sp.]
MPAINSHFRLKPAAQLRLGSTDPCRCNDYLLCKKPKKWEFPHQHAGRLFARHISLLAFIAIRRMDECVADGLYSLGDRAKNMARFEVHFIDLISKTGSFFRIYFGRRPILILLNKPQKITLVYKLQQNAL